MAKQYNDPIQYDSSDVTYDGLSELRHSLDALVVSKRTIQHSFDAVLRATVSRNHSLDTLIRATVSRNHSLDTLIRATKTHTHAFDVVLRSTVSRTHSLDVFKKLTHQLQHSFDVFIQSAGQVVHSLDVVVKATKTIQHSFDSIIRLTAQRTHSLDVVLRATRTTAHSLDSVILATRTRAHSFDFIAKATRTPQHSLDAFVVSRVQRTHALDVVVLKVGTQQHLFDSSLVSRIQIVHSLDLVAKKTGSVSHAFDAFPSTGKEVFHSFDLLVVKISQLTHNLDAYLVSRQSISHNFDSQTVTRTTTVHSFDTRAVTRQQITHSVDATILKRATLSHGIDAQVFDYAQAKRITHGIDSYLKLPLSEDLETEEFVADVVEDIPEVNPGIPKSIPWWNLRYHFRLWVAVKASPTGLKVNHPVRVPIDFAKLQSMGKIRRDLRDIKVIHDRRPVPFVVEEGYIVFPTKNQLAPYGEDVYVVYYGSREPHTNSPYEAPRWPYHLEPTHPAVSYHYPELWEGIEDATPSTDSGSATVSLYADSISITFLTGPNEGPAMIEGKVINLKSDRVGFTKVVFDSLDVSRLTRIKIHGRFSILAVDYRAVPAPDTLHGEETIFDRFSIIDSG